MAQTENRTDYYAVLGVARNACAAEIRRAYRSLALKLHPDNNRSDSGKAEREFQQLLEAYDVISDSYSRACYDFAIGAGERRFTPAELGRMGLADAMFHAGGAASGKPLRVRLKRPEAVVVSAVLAGLGSVALSIFWTTGAIGLGAVALALATLALTAVGSAWMPMRVATVASAARSLCIAGLCIAGAKLCMRVSLLAVRAVDRELPARVLEWLGPAGYVVAWFVLASAAFMWLGTSRSRFGREEFRWQEYRFLLVVLGLGLAWGMAATQLSAAVAPAYYHYMQVGEKVAFDEVIIADSWAHWQAARAGSESLWQVGLVIGLTVLLANSPHRRLPQLSYKGMLRRLVGPMLAVPAGAILFAGAGATGALGDVLAGTVIAAGHHPHRVMAARGLSLGEFAGTVLAMMWTMISLLRLRGKQARRIRTDQMLRFRPQLPAPSPEAGSGRPGLDS